MTLRIIQHIPHNNNGAEKIDGSATRAALQAAADSDSQPPLPGQTAILPNGTEAFLGQIKDDLIRVFPMSDDPCFWAPRNAFTRAPQGTNSPHGSGH